MAPQLALGAAETCFIRGAARPMRINAQVLFPGRRVGGLGPCSFKRVLRCCAPAIHTSPRAPGPFREHDPCRLSHRPRKALLTRSGRTVPTATGAAAGYQLNAEPATAGLKWLWLPAALAGLVAVLPSPPGAVFLAYVLTRWVAPAMAIWGLVHQQDKSSWVLAARRALLAAALYGYIIIMGMPRSMALVSIGMGPQVPTLRMSLPSFAAKWITSSPAAPVAFQAVALRIALGIAAAAAIKLFMHHRSQSGVVLETASVGWQTSGAADSEMQPRSRQGPQTDEAHTPQKTSAEQAHGTKVWWTSNSADQQDLADRLRTFRTDIKTAIMNLAWLEKCSGVPTETLCLEPVTGEGMTLKAYAGLEHTRLSSYASMYRDLSSRLGTLKEDDPTLASLSTGLRNAVARVHGMRNAALSGALSSSSETPVDLSAAIGRHQNDVERAGPARQSDASAPSAAAAEVAARPEHWLAGSAPLTQDQVLGQMGRDPYSILSAGTLRQPHPSKPSPPAAPQKQQWPWTHSHNVVHHPGDFFRSLEVLGKTLVDRLATKLSVPHNSADTPASAPVSPAGAPPAADPALLAALKDMTNSLHTISDRLAHDVTGELAELAATVDEAKSDAAQLRGLQTRISALENAQGTLQDAGQHGITQQPSAAPASASAEGSDSHDSKDSGSGKVDGSEPLSEDDQSAARRLILLAEAALPGLQQAVDNLFQSSAHADLESGQPFSKNVVENFTRQVHEKLQRHYNQPAEAEDMSDDEDEPDSPETEPEWVIGAELTATAEAAGASSFNLLAEWHDDIGSHGMAPVAAVQRVRSLAEQMQALSHDLRLHSNSSEHDGGAEEAAGERDPEWSSLLQTAEQDCQDLRQACRKDVRIPVKSVAYAIDQADQAAEHLQQLLPLMRRSISAAAGPAAQGSPPEAPTPAAGADSTPQHWHVDKDGCVREWGEGDEDNDEEVADEEEEGLDDEWMEDGDQDDSAAISAPSEHEEEEQEEEDEEEYGSEEEYDSEVEAEAEYEASEDDDEEEEEDYDVDDEWDEDEAEDDYHVELITSASEEAGSEAEEEGEDVPVQQVVRSVEVKFVGAPALSKGSLGHSKAKTGDVIKLAFADKDDQWSPDEDLRVLSPAWPVKLASSPGESKAKTVDIIKMAFADKDDQWSPDQDQDLNSSPGAKPGKPAGGSSAPVSMLKVLKDNKQAQNAQTAAVAIAKGRTSQGAPVAGAGKDVSVTKADPYPYTPVEGDPTVC